MKNILITGGSGLIGKSLTSLLKSKGFKVAWLSRNPKKEGKQKSFVWHPEAKKIDQKALEWCDGIIHLAGAGVAEKRWTEKRKKTILESRTKSTRLLVKSISKAEKKPHVFVSASAAGYYGFNPGPGVLDEESPQGDDFLAEVVVKWEEEVKKIQALGIRTVILRTGTVLDKRGGALPELLKPPVAAPLGDGEQYMSWIHYKDLAELYAFMLIQPLAGTYNAVAPHPVTNKELTKMAAKAKGKPFLPVPVPGFLLKLVLGEMANMVIGGSNLSSTKTENTGFRYKFPHLKEALEDIYS